MKKIIYAVMLLLGLSIMASCEKEGTEADKGKLEGKWWVAEKFEVRFNGEVIKSFPTLEEAEWIVDKGHFENGNVMLETDGDIGTYSYSFYNNTLIILGISLDIVKLTSKELVLDMILGKGNLIQWEITAEDLKEGQLLAQYKGKDIYSRSGITYLPPYWYYDNKGNAVLCGHYGDLGDSNMYWYDTERYYFKAE